MMRSVGFGAGLPAEGRNAIVESLPPESRDALRDHLHEVELERNQVLFAEEEGVERLCFPLSCVISRLVGLADGTTVEVSLAGREGLIGFPALLESRWSAFRALVQVPGKALFLPGKEAKRLLELPGAADVLFLYMFTVLREISVNAACGPAHSAIERLSRWLLSMQDRAEQADLGLTQEFLAQMLGVRRESVTVAAQELRSTGAIDYTRGTISITDRARLEQHSCACYTEVVDGYVRFLESTS